VSSSSRSCRSICSVALSFALLAGLPIITGCAVGTPLAPSDSAITMTGLSGKVHGGQQPIYGATIDILAAGTGTGYGAGAATILTGPVVKTAADGSFNINGNFSCPSGSSQIYLTATGGDPTGLDNGSINNSAIKLAAALGPCSNLSTSTFISVNEVTTVAAAFGLGQFFGGFGTAADSIGAPSTNVIGLTNAFATAHNVASTGTGIVAPTSAASGTNYYVVANDQSKINTMANILADCINQGLQTAPITAYSISSNVATFTANNNYVAGASVTLSGFPTSTFFNDQTVTVLSTGLSGTQFEASFTNADVTTTTESGTGTAQPNNSAACVNLFAAVTPSHAPRTTSTAATLPSDTFQAAVYMALNPTSTNSTSSATNITTLMGMQSAFQPFSPALSSSPADWTIAVQYLLGGTYGYTSSTAVDANGDIWFSSAATTGGVFVLNGGTGTAVGTAGITGGVSPLYSTFNSLTPNGVRQVAIDLNGKAWFPGYTQNTIFRATSGVGTDAYFTVPTGPTLPYAIAVDPSDNIVITTAGNQILHTSGTATSGTAMTSTANLEYSSGGANAIAINGSSLAFSPQTTGAAVYEFSSSTFTAASPASVSPTNLTAAYGAAIDGSGRFWVANKPSSGGSLVSITGPSGSQTYAQITSGCFNIPEEIAVDGGNNLWVSNDGPIGGLGTVCEFNSSGTLISSSSGFGSHGLSNARGIAIDPAGNVWVSNYTTGSTGYAVTELVGAGQPTITPIALAIKNGTVGTLP